MSTVLILPFLICFSTVVLTTLTWRRTRLQKMIHLIASAVFLFSAILLLYKVRQSDISTIAVGGYQAPFGILLVVDYFSALMIFMSAMITFVVGLYSLTDISKKLQRLGYYPLFWLLNFGVIGALMTGDLFNLYVWFEVMLISSFVLLIIGHHKSQLEGALKYVSIHFLATMFMLLAIGLIYGLTGTLNMADLNLLLAQSQNPTLVTTSIVLIVLAFSIKAALFPLFFWLPSAYHTANGTTAAIFSGILTKIGVYALIRTMTLLLPDNVWILTLLLFSATMTMITGVLGAVVQYNFKRLLSFHIISQVGYMIMGLAIYTPFAIAAAIFYTVHHMIVKTNLFLLSSISIKIGKTSDIRKLGGYYDRYPVIALLFFISAFSLAGLPPFSGFWSKLLIFQAAVYSGHAKVAIAALAVGLLTLYSMNKLWVQVFWKTPPPRPDLESNAEHLSYYLSLLPCVILASMTLAISFFPQPIFDFMLQVSQQLLHPELYVQAVMQGRHV